MKEDRLWTDDSTRPAWGIGGHQGLLLGDQLVVLSIHGCGLVLDIVGQPQKAKDVYMDMCLVDQGPRLRPTLNVHLS